MLNLKPFLFRNILKYAIVDIETTGGSSKTEKITEIAIYLHDGNQKVAEFTTLINPERPIPAYITSLTGISNAMVSGAPKFYEVAKDIVLLTEGAVFVAHNVNFDYGFIRNEFARLGYDYKRETLDTVKLSRKLLPGHASYSLGNLCSDLDIRIDGRHRAAGDALATVQLFEILLKKINGVPVVIENNAFNELKYIDKKFYDHFIATLPASTGIYYFHDAEGKLIYIGKSIDIRKRVIQHFQNTQAKKAIEMRQKIAGIGYTLTGSELVALLLESDEIKKHKPLYNRAQRRTAFSFALYAQYNLEGYLELKIDKTTSKSGEPLISFHNLQEGRVMLTRWIEKYTLCQKLCGEYKTNNSCFNYEIRKCNGACIGIEAPDVYNSRIKLLLEEFRFRNSDFYIIDQGRNDDERAVIQVKNSVYRGFGYLHTEHLDNQEMLHDCIKPYADNRDIRQIIRLYIDNNPVKIIEG